MYQNMISGHLLMMIILVISYTFSELRKYQKILKNAQPIKVDFKFSENVPAGIYGYALVLTNKLVSKSSDGQRHFDLI